MNKIHVYVDYETLKNVAPIRSNQKMKKLVKQRERDSNEQQECSIPSQTCSIGERLEREWWPGRYLCTLRWMLAYTCSVGILVVKGIGHLSSEEGRGYYRLLHIINVSLGYHSALYTSQKTSAIVHDRRPCP
ncbi:hypothetical protein TNCV_4626251 [Trichonephila clavipes]|nr:hypothetical protein TNCV_4626251 [Trichonephila clavipes]